MARLLKLRVTPIARRVFSVLVLVGVCAASLPLPVPVVAAVLKDRSIPFPCQDHPCGCRDAKQCWTTCGCMSMAEKLRWAESKGITPPSYVDTKARAKPSCCASKVSICCSKTSSGCRDSGAQCRHNQRTPKQPMVFANDVPLQTVLLTSYIAKCNGHDTLITLLPWSIIPKPVPRASVTRHSVWQWVNVDERFLSAQTEPPIPPPRRFVLLVA